jgi:hypothetical protein
VQPGCDPGGSAVPEYSSTYYVLVGTYIVRMIVRYRHAYDFLKAEPRVHRGGADPLLKKKVEVPSRAHEANRVYTSEGIVAILKVNSAGLNGIYWKGCNISIHSVFSQHQYFQNKNSTLV